MSIYIKEINTRQDLQKFIRFPNQLYRHNQYYVPELTSDELNTLSSEKNPAFKHCDARYWLAYRDGEIVGRVAAILNRKHIEKWNQLYLRFGWLDFIDDEDVSGALMGAVEDWAGRLHMQAIHGPLGFTNLDRAGMLIAGFDELATMATSYNYPYYPQHMERMGYVKDTDYFEYELIVPIEQNEKIARAAAIVLKRNHLTLLKVRRKKELLPYARELFNLINDEYSHLYGTVPLTEAQISRYINQFFGFIHPDFVPVVLDKHGRIVAFGVTIPSLSRALQKSRGKQFPFGWWHLLYALRKNDRADLYLVAVKKEYQGMGVNAILMDHINKVFIRHGIRKVESNPEMETNVNVQSQWKFFEQRQHKRRRCFIKHL